MFGVVLATLLFTGLDLTGTPTCPALADVRARLDPLLPTAGRLAGENQTADHHVRVDRSTTALSLTLQDAAGTLLAERTLTTNASCADLAAAAAVVIATWEVELQGRGTIGLSLAAPPPPLALPAPLPSPAAPTLWRIGAAGGLSVVPDSVAPFAALDLLVAPHTRILRGRLSLGAAGGHKVALGPAHVRWNRLAVGAGLQLETPDPGFYAAASLQGLMSVLFLAGEGFPSNLTDTALEPGGNVGGRLGWRFHSWLPYLYASWNFWPLRQELSARAFIPPSTALPRWEILMGAGCDLALFP